MGWHAFLCAHDALPGFGPSLLANKLRESSERSVPYRRRCRYDHVTVTATNGPVAKTLLDC
jgi:hypothetical protein